MASTQRIRRCRTVADTAKSSVREPHVNSEMNKLIRLVTRRRRLILAFLFFTSLLFGLLNSFPDKYTVLHIANNLSWRLCSSKYSIYCKPQDKYALVPAGFPKSGNGLWYKFPGKVWSRDFLPIGNGFLGAMIPGGSNYEIIQLNIESLWTGGPFADPVSTLLQQHFTRRLFNRSFRTTTEGTRDLQRLRKSVLP